MPMARSFTSLDRTRQPGFNMPAPINYREIKAYIHYYPQFDEIFFVELMLFIDSLYLRKIADDHKRTAGKN